MISVVLGLGIRRVTYNTGTAADLQSSFGGTSSIAKGGVESSGKQQAHDTKTKKTCTHLRDSTVVDLLRVSRLRGNVVVRKAYGLKLPAQLVYYRGTHYRPSRYGVRREIMLTCSRKRSPPTKKHIPRIKSRLARMEPSSEAWTIRISFYHGLAPNI